MRTVRTALASVIPCVYAPAIPRRIAAPAAGSLSLPPSPPGSFLRWFQPSLLRHCCCGYTGLSSLSLPLRALGHQGIAPTSPALAPKRKKKDARAAAIPAVAAAAKKGKLVPRTGASLSTTTTTAAAAAKVPSLSAKVSSATTTSTTAASKKKKRNMPNKSYYAVARGRNRGIYTDWGMCSEQVTGFQGAVHKGFKDLEGARAFLQAHPVAVAARDVVDVDAYDGGDSEASSGYGLSSSSGSRTLRVTLPITAHRAVGQGQKRQRSPSPPWAAAAHVAPPAQRQRTTLTPTTPSNDAMAVLDVHDVYVDGACSKNGRRTGAKAGYGGYYGNGDRRNFSLPLSPGEAHTNNRAELHAVLHALQQGFRDGGIDPDTFGSVAGGEGWQRLGLLRVHTDSKYVIDGLTKYSTKWVRNGFRVADGSPVLNQDLWKSLLRLRNGYQDTFAQQWGAHPAGQQHDGGFEIRHVKGHSGVHGNTKADELAVNGAQKPYQR